MFYDEEDKRQICDDLMMRMEADGLIERTFANGEEYIRLTDKGLAAKREMLGLPLFGEGEGEND